MLIDTAEVDMWIAKEVNKKAKIIATKYPDDRSFKDPVTEKEAIQAYSALEKWVLEQKEVLTLVERMFGHVKKGVN